MREFDYIIQHFSLQPHPEGGYYSETYRSHGIIPATVLPDIGIDHVYSTAIYYLLPAGEKSHWHRIRQDEIWHFYAGQALRLVIITLSGDWQEIILGTDYKNGQNPQAIVPANCYFAATPAPQSEYSFVGCTVAPGFDFADFELASKDQLLSQYPQWSEKIDEFIAND